jgi:hypothetical protein
VARRDRRQPLHPEIDIDELAVRPGAHGGCLALRGVRKEPLVQVRQVLDDLVRNVDEVEVQLPHPGPRGPGPHPCLAQLIERERLHGNCPDFGLEVENLGQDLVVPERGADMHSIAEDGREAIEHRLALLHRVAPPHPEVDVAVPDPAVHPLGQVERLVELVEAPGDEQRVVAGQGRQDDRHVHVVPFPADLGVPVRLPGDRELGRPRDGLVGRAHGTFLSSW